MGTYGWPIPGGGLADERFLTGGSSPELTNELSLGALSSGIFCITTSGGVVTSVASIVPGADGTFLRSQGGVMAFAALPSSVPALTSTQVAYGHSDNTLTSSAELTYATATGTFDLAKSRSGAAVTSKTRNTSNTASSSAGYVVEVGGASAGDATYQAVVASTTTWTWGVTNAASDRWAIAPAATLGTSSDVITISTSGNIGLNSAPNSSYVIASQTSGLVLFGALSTGTSQRGGFNATGGGGTEIDVVAYGSAHSGTTLGETKAGLVSLEAFPSASNGFHIGVSGATFIGFTTNSLRRLTISGTGNVSIGAAALATNATDGFLYVPSCAGTPTGTPTSITGRVPIVVDTTNHKLYFYDGSWRDAGP